MMMQSIGEAVGGTPIVKLGENPLKAAKLEMMNPGGSVKDRTAYHMIREAERESELEGVDRIVEATSGNTGIGVAMACAELGYEAWLTIPQEKGSTKVDMMKAYGAKVVETYGWDERDEDGHREIAREIGEEEDAYFLNQYENQDSPEAHYYETGMEMVDELHEEPDYFFAAMSTGGTISGIGKCLKEFYPDIEIIGVESERGNLADIFYDRDYEEGVVDIEGAGKHYKCPVADFEVIDDIVQVGKSHAHICTKRLATEHGILVGESAGATLAATYEFDTEDDDFILTLFADSGDRYLDGVHSR